MGAFERVKSFFGMEDVLFEEDMEEEKPQYTSRTSKRATAFTDSCLK